MTTTPTPGTDPQAARQARRTALRNLITRVGRGRAGADIGTMLGLAVDAEIADADEAHTRLADYENRISWETTCGEHARLLDACQTADERAEQAETALNRVWNLADQWEHALAADAPYARALRAALDGTGDAEPAPAPQSKPPGIFSGVQGRCPACRRAALILSTGGYIICSHLECPDPEAAAKLLERDEPAVDWQDIAAQREHTLGQVRAVRDHWIRNTLEPGQVRRLLDDLTHALDGTEPATPDPDPCDTYQPPTTPEDSGYCAHCGMSDYKHRAGPADRRILAAFRPLFTPETPHTPV